MPPAAGRVALGIEYRGSAYKGWQTQKKPQQPSIQENLEKALSFVAAHPVSVVCAGRTDAGVHASAQVVHFDTGSERPLAAWVRGCNSMLPADIRVQWARKVDSDFHARFSALSRRYRYFIDNRAVKSAILNQLVSPHPFSLDAGLMHEAAQHLLGEHDFSAFRGAGCQSRTAVRKLTEISVTRRGHFVILDVEGNAFLLHMVRNIVGTLLEVGEGRRPPGWVAEVLASRQRKEAGMTALPAGLHLVAVTYPAVFALPESLHRFGEWIG